MVSEQVETNYSTDEILKYQKYVRKVNDLEALEIAARYTGNLKLLSEKFIARVYIAETVPENYGVFINDQNNLLKGYFLSMLAVVSTVVKVVKGLILLKFVK